MKRFGWIVALTCVVGCVVGCWSDDDTVNGFTAAQWRGLQQSLKFPTNIAKAELCSLDGFDDLQCSLAHDLGNDLFQETGLSSRGSCAPDGGISCKTCHNGPGWIDTRMPNATSLGVTKWTTRNAMSVLNGRYKFLLAKQPEVFTWSGGSAPDLAHRYTSPGSVTRLAIEKPMNNTTNCVEDFIAATPKYADRYHQLFPGAVAFANVEKIFDAYLMTDPALATMPTTPFDLWLLGVSSTMSDRAKRGFGLFTGKAGCIECHSGPLFSDLDFHNTGVKIGQGTSPDNGREIVTTNPDDTGKFLTAPLRDIASTAPYMHNGQYNTLHDVIEFYKRGGDDGVGVRDPRIQPLDLSDDDEMDLEAFLRSLTDCDDDSSCPGGGSGSGSGSGSPPVDAGVGSDAPPVADAFQCQLPNMLCSGMCFSVQTDPANCGACGHVCTYPTLNCVSGQCVQ